MHQPKKSCWNCAAQDDRPLDVETGLCVNCTNQARFEGQVTEALPSAQDALNRLAHLAYDRAGLEALTRALERLHRTNQQLVCGAVIAMLEKWAADAEKPGHWDARNEAAVNFAALVIETIPERARYLPYI